MTRASSKAAAGALGFVALSGRMTGASMSMTPAGATLTLTDVAPTVAASFVIDNPISLATGAVTETVGDSEPPLLAESLLCIFARTKDIDALMGCFEEHFARDCASGMSQRRANVRYWSRVLHSIGPQILQAIRRVGLLGLIAAALRR